MNERSAILIVDDNPQNLRVLSSYLDELGFDILVAKSGAKALEIARGNSPDVILLDIMMPGMDGYQTCTALKNDDRTRPIPVIFVSAKGQPGGDRSGFELGAVDFIRKPFNLTELYVRLRTHVENKKLRDLLEKQATVDRVTNIANRMRFEAYLDESWKRASRAHSSLSVIMIDIDHFKAYNDHYGHTLGDVCLKRVATVLASCVRRPSDLLARYGGEEFICLLPDVALDGAVHVAEGMLNGVRQARFEHVKSPTTPTVTISVGVAAVEPSPTIGAKALVDAADRCLYQAKNSGRNRVVS